MYSHSGRGKSVSYLGLCNLEVSHLDTTCRKVWNLKLDLNRSLRTLAANTAHATTKTTSHATADLVIAAHAGQTKLRTHQKLLVATKLLNLPDNGALLRGIVYGADVGAEARRVGVVGNGDNDLDIVGRASSLELGPSLEHIFNARARVRLDGALDPDQGLDLRVEAVRHELELAVGRYKGDCAVIFKTRQAHALVEFDVFHLDRLAARCASGRLEHYFIVEAQSQLGHATEVALHLDCAENLAAQDVAVGADEQVQALDDIEEDFVFAVSDAL